MLVPDYWAEARLQHRSRGRQLTIRRFGWSMQSSEDAQRHAEQRVAEAMAEALTGADVRRRERRVGYNGGEGVPIREEVLARQGEAVITRNSYGARCLNTPALGIADVDFGQGPGRRFVGAVAAALLIVVVVLRLLGALHDATGPLIGALLLFYPLAQLAHAALRRMTGGEAAWVRRRARRWAAAHPRASLRLYRTPAGMRVIATDAPADPRGPVTAALFDALAVDRVYAAMCRNQNCFRARLTPKPWRVGIERHLKPRRRAWPLPPEALEARACWLVRYEAAAIEYAACQYVETVGSGYLHPELRDTLALHDQESGALSRRPIA